MTLCSGYSACIGQNSPRNSPNLLYRSVSIIWQYTIKNAYTSFHLDLKVMSLLTSYTFAVLQGLHVFVFMFVCMLCNKWYKLTMWVQMSSKQALTSSQVYSETKYSFYYHIIAQIEYIMPHILIKCNIIGIWIILMHALSFFPFLFSIFLFVFVCHICAFVCWYLLPPTFRNLRHGSELSYTDHGQARNQSQVVSLLIHPPSCALFFSSCYHGYWYKKRVKICGWSCMLQSSSLIVVLRGRCLCCIVTWTWWWAGYVDVLLHLIIWY